MSSIDKLYFPPTGEETSPYLLVTVSGDGGALKGSVAVAPPAVPGEGSGDLPSYPGAASGDLAAILKEADEFAALQGYPLRIDKPDDVDFPAELGTYAERRIEE